MTQQLLHAPLVWGVAEVGLVGRNSSQERQAVLDLLFQGLDYVTFRHERDVVRKLGRVFGWGWFGGCCMTHVKTPLKIDLRNWEPVSLSEPALQPSARLARLTNSWIFS